MDKQKDRAEIAQIITDNDCCSSNAIARYIVENGYGNIEQALTEFAERLKDKISLLRFCDVATTEYEYYHSALNDVTYDIEETLKEFLNERDG